jgi:hypothetical protein
MVEFVASWIALLSMQLLDKADCEIGRSRLFHVSRQRRLTDKMPSFLGPFSLFHNELKANFGSN